jgi:hypothetical protein
VSQGLAATLRALSKSRNDAATAVLVAALDGDEPSMSALAVRGLMERRSKAGQLAVLRRWRDLSDAQREACDFGRGRIAAALRDALVSGDDRLFEAAAQLALRFDEFELVATLIHVAENSTSPHVAPAIYLVQQLVDALATRLSAPADPHGRHDLQGVRCSLLESLAGSLARYRTHQRTELVEAYVALAGPECETLRKILDDPHHACFDPVIHALSHGSNPAITSLLMGMLKVPQLPHMAAKILERRTDRPLIEALLGIGLPCAAPTAANLQQITELAWLASPRQFVTAFPAAEQQAQAMRLATAAGLRAAARLDIVAEMLECAEPAGQAAALEMLAAIPGDRANKMIRAALQSNEPEVQAAAARLLRERPMPGVMNALVELVSSPHPAAAAAAREALSEFSMDNYLRRFEALEESIRTTTGQLVLKVDPEAIDKLRRELEDSHRMRRLRAIRAATSVGGLPLLADALVQRLEDEDHVVRAAAAEALQHCTGSDVRDALLAALNDRSRSVQNAAEASLSALEGAVWATTTPPERPHA